MSDTSDSPSGQADGSGPTDTDADGLTTDEAAAEAARREQRVTINKEFESFDAFVHEYVTNISRTGAFVKSQTPLAIGTLVDLHFTVFMDDVETITGVGEVVRVQDDPPGMGVVFRELSRYSQQLIGRLLTLPRTPATKPSTNPPPSGRRSTPPPSRTEPET